MILANLAKRRNEHNLAAHAHARMRHAQWLAANAAMSHTATDQRSTRMRALVCPVQSLEGGLLAPDFSQ
jgi:hypothetical protein